MIVVALALVLMCAVLVAGWALRNSEREREELRVAVHDLRVAVETALAPLAGRIDRLAGWIDRQLRRRS